MPVTPAFGIKGQKDPGSSVASLAEGQAPGSVRDPDSREYCGEQ